MVAAGNVRARIVCCGHLWALVGAWDVGACLCCTLAMPCMRVVAPARWTGCDVDECFGVCVRCVMVWSDAAACMGVV